MRVQLHGQGTLIPDVALPDPNVDTNFPPQTFLYTDNGEFDKRDWEGLGYTNFEVVCIGGTGGRGGNASLQVTWVNETSPRAVSQGVWDLVRERASLGDYLRQASLYNNPDTGDKRQNYTVAPALNRVYQPWLYAVFSPGLNCWITDVRDETVHPTYIRWHEIMQEFGHADQLTVSSPVYTPQTPYYSPGAYPYWWGFTQWTFWQGTYLDMFEYHHSNHQLTANAYTQVKLETGAQFIQGIGGAPGGGGRHVVSGFLADLPDISPVVVGKSGADAPVGQILKNGTWVPTMADAPKVYGLYPPYVDTFPAYVGGGTAQAVRIGQIEAYLDNYLNSFSSPPSLPNPQSGQDGGASSFGGDLAQASGGKGGGPSVGYPGGVITRQAAGGDGGAGGRITAGGGGLGGITSGQVGQDGTWDGDIGKGGGGGRAGAAALNHPYVTPPIVLPAANAGNGGRGSYSFSDTSVYGPRQGKSGITPGGGGGSVLNSATHYGSKALNATPDGAVFVRVIKVDV